LVVRLASSHTNDRNQNGVNEQGDLADATSRDDNGDAMAEECTSVIR
jgi:hypothetical protein